jgi:hypothetical protein
MITPSDRDSSSPVRQGVASYKLVRRRDAAVGQKPERRPRPEHSRDTRPVVTPTHQPSDAECYGCVDWFHF